MQFGGFGYPATKASGFNKAVPSFGKFTSPGFAGGKPFGGLGFGKPFGGLGFPATKASGFNKSVPSTSVSTSPYPFI